MVVHDEREVGRKDGWAFLGQIPTVILNCRVFSCIFLASAMPFGELAGDYWHSDLNAWVFLFFDTGVSLCSSPWVAFVRVWMQGSISYYHGYHFKACNLIFGWQTLSLWSLKFLARLWLRKLDWAGLHCPKGSKTYNGLEETRILSLGRGLGCQLSSRIRKKAWEVKHCLTWQKPWRPSERILGGDILVHFSYRPCRSWACRLLQSWRGSPVGKDPCCQASRAWVQNLRGEIENDGHRCPQICTSTSLVGTPTTK